MKKKGGDGIAAGSGVRVAVTLSSSLYCRRGKEEGKLSQASRVGHMQKASLSLALLVGMENRQEIFELFDIHICLNINMNICIRI